MYSSLSPKIIPIFSLPHSITGVAIEADTIIRTRARNLKKGNLKVDIKVYIDGINKDNFHYDLAIENSTSKNPNIWQEFCYEQHGYAEIYISSNTPVFTRVISEPGYAILKINDSAIVINPDFKFGRTRLISQMQNHNSFCMVHSAIVSDKENNIRNSFLLINPYEKIINVRITSDVNKFIKKKLVPHTVTFIDVSQLINNNKLGSVMLSAQNRVVVYDIKHHYNDINKIYSIDHLDPYSGRTNYSNFSFKGLIKNQLRSILSKLNIRYD